MALKCESKQYKSEKKKKINNKVRIAKDDEKTLQISRDHQSIKKIEMSKSIAPTQ